MKARNLFIGGTASHAGKSWMATAVCRYLRNRGIRVAPFKAQNMSNNSYACANGGEIGRAQVAQAEACGLAPATDMNPILLKPDSDCTSQIVLDGKVWGTGSGSAYYRHFDFFLSRVMAAYDRLASEYEFIVIEGAGSVAEVNLKSRDLVNLGFAMRVNAPGLLVADIDRGGVFASIIGTLDLLSADERASLRSFAVNRFRGEPKLFSDGVAFLEERTKLPCLGVFPMAHGIHLDAEDAVSLEDARGAETEVAAIHFPHVSNFTDLDRVAARWLREPDRKLYSYVILPGTKNTFADLEWMRARGFDDWLRRQHAAGATVIGICGGYQMLGETIDGHDALGMLPVRTVMRDDKVVKQIEDSDAYEIHMGATEIIGDYEPFTYVDGQPEGIRLGRVWGTYLHGSSLGIEIVPPIDKNAMYDKLADWFAASADVKQFEELYL